MLYRPIRKAEIPIVAEIQSRAFRRDAARYLEAYEGPWRFSWRDLRVLEDEQGTPVAAVTLFHRAVSLNGSEMPAGLVGGVAVPPEQRRRGYASAMMGGLLEELSRHKTPLSLLFPFSSAWYQRLGYGLANLTWHLTIPPRLLVDHVERRNVRRCESDDEAGMRACYERARLDPRNNGWLARSDWEWTHRVWKLEHESAVYETDGRVEGYLVYTLAWGGEGAPVEVIEWVWTSEAAWRGLAGFLAALGDQATAIVHSAPQGDPLLLSLPEPYDRMGRAVEFVFYPTAQLISGFMLRVVHLPEALRQRRYPSDLRATLLLQVDDPQLPANSQPWQVEFAGGAATVRPAVQRLAAAQHARLAAHTDIATFGQLFAGLLSAEQARLTGRLQADDTTCALLSVAFAAAPWHMWEADWF